MARGKGVSPSMQPFSYEWQQWHPSCRTSGSVASQENIHRKSVFKAALDLFFCSVLKWLLSISVKFLERCFDQHLRLGIDTYTQKSAPACILSLMLGFCLRYFWQYNWKVTLWQIIIQNFLSLRWRYLQASIKAYSFLSRRPLWCPLYHYNILTFHFKGLLCIRARP